MDIKRTPTLTVFVTLFNVAEYLPRFFQCMAKQTYGDYVLLIIDDGSEDDTLRICESYAGKDPRISLKHIPHAGITAARNYAISLIDTPFAASADGDDIYGPDYLLHLVEGQRKHDADLVISRVAYCNEELKRTLIQKKRGELLVRKDDFAETLPSLLDDGRLNFLYAKLFRSRILKTTFVEEDVRQGSDTMFCCQYAVKADSILLIDDLDTNYIKYSSRSVTSYQGKDKYKRDYRTQTTITEIFQKAGLLNGEMQRIIDGRIFKSALWSSSPVAKGDDRVPEAELGIKDIFRSPVYLEAFERQKENLSAFHFHVPDPYAIINHPVAECRLIVSLTSYPSRISFVPEVLKTIFGQTRKADEVILWLAEEQFPERALPKELVRFEKEGKLTIRWCGEDLLSHKKYFYAFREFPGDLVITIDDDVLYSPTMIEKLFRSYLINPRAVSAARAHKMILEEGKLLPYADWLSEYSLHVLEPSMLLFAKSGAGTLFPVSLFNPKLLDSGAIRENCLYSDDIWLKMMQAEAGIPAVLAEPFSGLNVIPGTQENALGDYNANHYDEQLENAVRWFDADYGEGFILSRLESPGGTKADMIQYYKAELKKKDAEIKTLKTDLRKVQTSASLRIGRWITCPGKKIKDLLRRKI